MSADAKNTEPMDTEPTTPLPDAAATLPIPDDAVDGRPDDAVAGQPDAAASAHLHATAAPQTSAPTEPRTRWAAIIWGLFFAAVAGTGIWLLGDSGRQDAVTDWIATLNPGTITAVILLSVGILVLIGGLAGLLRRAQKRLSRS